MHINLDPWEKVTTLLGEINRERGQSIYHKYISSQIITTMSSYIVDMSLSLLFVTSPVNTPSSISLKKVQTLGIGIVGRIGVAIGELLLLSLLCFDFSLSRSIIMASIHVGLS